MDNGDIELDEVLSVDLCPDVNQEELRVKFTNDFQDKGKTFIKNYLKYFLTNNFIKFFWSNIIMTETYTLIYMKIKTRSDRFSVFTKFIFTGW